jgi:hypothetical protein
LKAQARRVFIKSSDLEELQDLHLSYTGQDLLHSSLTRNVIKHYLSREGLNLLKNEFSKHDNRDQMKVVTKLLILEELMKTLNIPEVELGFNGGLKFAVLNDYLKGISSQK